MADPPSSTTTTTTATSTRLSYAHQLLTNPLPPYPSPAYAHLHAALCTVLAALTTHPAMAPNLSQPHDNPTPALRTKVYFMWDFVARTLENLHQIQLGGGEGAEDDTKPELERQEEKLEDIKGRVAYARSLILEDIRAGKMGGGRGGTALERMMGEVSMAGEIGTERVSFGKGVERAARGL